MKVNGSSYRTVWLEEGTATVKLIEQNKLPFEFCVVSCQNHEETSVAIETMIVRGAGAIGATAGFAMAQVIAEASDRDGDSFLEFVQKGKQRIEVTRPTAQNLFYATNRVYDAVMNSLKNSDGDSTTSVAIKEATAIANEDVESCQFIGQHGAELIQDGANIETHCNAGWLAFVDYGSALSPIYAARDQGKHVHVWVDETRPRSQGARLTAWELYNEGIPHSILPDNAGAHYMSQGKVDLIIVGADRIASNGDVANKIGTLEKAICAKHYNIPFYVAAPLSTFDLDCENGQAIPIEERSSSEVLYQTGPSSSDNTQCTIRVASPGSNAVNPAFDVTPANLITGIITPKGIIKPTLENIAELFGS